MNTCAASEKINTISVTRIISGKDELIKKLDDYGYKQEDFDFKVMPLFFDKGFLDGYREYNALFAVPKDEINEAYCAILNFQQSILKLVNISREVILESATENYDYKDNPKCFFIFEDNNDDKNKTLIKELENYRANKMNTVKRKVKKK